MIPSSCKRLAEVDFPIAEVSRNDAVKAALVSAGRARVRCPPIKTRQIPVRAAVDKMGQGCIIVCY